MSLLDWCSTSLGVTALSPSTYVVPLIGGGALIPLALLGTLAAKASGAKMLLGTSRITSWSALAMAVTSGVRALFGVRA
jgi:VIT1/CCC1 family predicted Fe2+/Mn2+ transporter